MKETLQNFEKAFVNYYCHQYPTDKNPLFGACNWGLAGQGKRIRPLLVAMTNKMCGGQTHNILPPSIAVEMIHTYSLIHDDLPILDDDDLRRGRKTVHKQFDEPTALLAGDALLTDAFTVLSSGFEDTTNLSDKQRLLMVNELGSAAGGHGMVLGQMMDIYWTGRPGATQKDLNHIHLNKTGKLIAASCAMGAIAANEEPNIITKLRRFGELVGLSFQIIDDILDDKVGTGKSSGKDKAQGKLTWLSTMTPEEAQAQANEWTSEAWKILEPWKSDADELKELTHSLLNRQK
ncbi:MAG: hypothetical protein CMP10_01065 [Zetaproteobacteria bacterium]|nr:hypothetical protein [Pseudobdellovibrionaceae bacterium]